MTDQRRRLRGLSRDGRVHCESYYRVRSLICRARQVYRLRLAVAACLARFEGSSRPSRLRTLTTRTRSASFGGGFILLDYAGRDAAALAQLNSLGFCPGPDVSAALPGC
jgi:hypothetical protein